MVSSPTSSLPSISLRRIISVWWPLAISWMLMSAEPPLLSAVVARLANPEIHLAAYGSVAFPLISIIQAPILTLLSLSTAMSKDWDSYLKGRKLMLYVGGGLTVLYMLVAFTPLYYVIVRNVIGAPEEIIEPARLGMFVGLPWAFSVAYRRFHQGVMIRFEHSNAVTAGTLMRFMVDAVVLLIALRVQTIPGTVVASAMMVCGVITEALYVGWRVKPVLRYEVRNAPPLQNQIGLRELFAFFVPLGLTPLLNQLIRPIGSAALSRLPDPIVSLAIWPVISSLSFLIVTPGASYTEVVIALLDRSGAKTGLRRFMAILMTGQLGVMLMMALTPLSFLWFSRVSGLSPALAHLAAAAFLLLIPSSLLSPLNSWFTGVILHCRRSRIVTEGMILYLFIYITALTFGGRLIQTNGVFIAIGSSILASIIQTSWLGIRSRNLVASLDRA